MLKPCASLAAARFFWWHGRVAQLAEHSALNRQVVGSIPTASTKESSTYSNLLFRLRRTSPNYLKTPQIPPFQPQFFNRSLPVFEYR